LPIGAACPDCGYDLRGSTSTRCPECGFLLEVLRIRESQIPWSHRRQLGWFRAYWKTVWLVLRHPKRLCLEMSRPVSYPDSQSFRWVTLLHAYLPVVAGCAAGYLAERLDGSAVEEAGWWLIAGVLTWSLLALVLLPGLASYFFQARSLPIEQQNRAIALSYYAWAPLAAWLLVLPLLLVLLLLDMADKRLLRLPKLSDNVEFYIGGTCALSGVFIVIAGPVLTYMRLADFAWRIQHQRGLRGFLRMALLWFLSAALLVLLALLPALAFYLLVIWDSLR
jgi:hypothetical protein